jgi:hypothetical protein
VDTPVSWISGTIVLLHASAHPDIEYPIFGGCTWNPLHDELLQPGAFSAYASWSVLAQLCYLDAAMFRNHARRLPLHLAISHGKPWRDGIQVLFQAYSAAMERPDPVTDVVPLYRRLLHPNAV